MSVRERSGLLCLVGALAAPGLLLGAAGVDFTRLELLPTSELRLAGTTNVHGWECRSSKLEISARLEAAPTEIRSMLDDLEEYVATETTLRNLPLPTGLDAEFGLSVPIRDLDCGNRRMERDLQTTLRAVEHPAIHYRFLRVQEASLVSSTRGGPPMLVLVVAGELSLAGTSRPVVFPVEGRRLDPDRLQLRGRVPMKMTDFGLEPPVALLGLIKADDRLTVEVDLLLEIAHAPGSPRLERYGSAHVHGSHMAAPTGRSYP